mmetsp:Transcript_7155/g.12640  ORF Transcript_7155/g.12640 Transcript_7155/m.12640 type:complete len:214 (+) Transcript_7155:703-1344(+)
MTIVLDPTFSCTWGAQPCAASRRWYASSFAALPADRNSLNASAGANPTEAQTTASRPCSSFRTGTSPNFWVRIRRSTADRSAPGSTPTAAAAAAFPLAAPPRTAQSGEEAAAAGEEPRPRRPLGEAAAGEEPRARRPLGEAACFFTESFFFFTTAFIIFFFSCEFAFLAEPADNRFNLFGVTTLAPFVFIGIPFRSSVVHSVWVLVTLASLSL